MLIVDDFLDDAETIRQHALKLDYPPQEGEFPGRNSLQRINLEGLTEVVSQLVGEPLVPSGRPLSHAKCRLTMAADKGRGRVHIDQCHWSGILYLSRPEDCRGGTEFFRHKASGTDRFPLTHEELRALGYSTFLEAQEKMIQREGTVEEAWEPTMTVPMRFNRLVLLRPWLWHTAGPGFGDRPENARLVYLLFFQSAAKDS